MIGRAEKNGPQGDGLNQEVCFTLNTVDEHAVAYTFAEQNYSEYVLSPAGKAVAGLADDCYCWHERMVQSKSEPMPQCCGFIYKAGAKANGIGVGNETPTMKTDCPPAVAYSTNTQSDL